MNFLGLVGVLVILPATALGKTPIGKLSNLSKHGIAGTVYAIDEKTLRIEGFRYDGTGPDAWFYVGTQGGPSGSGTRIPYPSADSPKLGKFDGDVVILNLPDPLKATEIKWLSVWCRKFSANFGCVAFPDNLSLDENSAQEPMTPCTASGLEVRIWMAMMVPLVAWRAL